MSSCKVCHLDIKKHSKKMWALHQQAQICSFCQKNASEHSEKLWYIHNHVVEKGQFCPLHKKNEKLYPVRIGFARTTVSRVCRINADRPYDVDFVPIYMSCIECGLYLGNTEEDYADVLDETCLSCFRKLIGQTDIWYDIPLSKKITEKEVIE